MSTQSRYRIEGMHCASCVHRLESHLVKLPGVESVSVSLADQRALLQHEQAVDEQAVCDLVGSLGFTAVPEDIRTAPEAIPLPSWWPVLLALAAATVTMLVMWLWPEEGVTSWILTSIAVACGAKMLWSGAKALLRLHPDMHALVFIGVSAAWITGTVVLFAPHGGPLAGSHEHGGHLWFDAAAWITALVLLGRRLEASARAHMGDALAALMGSLPKSAQVLDEQGQEVQTPLDDLQVGMRIRLRAGDTVPVDALIEQGQSEVNEALLSGEPLPVLRQQGDKLAAGSSLIDGSCDATIVAVGAQSTLGRIAEQVRSAQASKAPIARLADRIAAVFVPIVALIALLSAAFWLFLGAAILGPEDPTPAVLALTAFVSVLVIACPCALGLATPAAVVVGMGQAARQGVLLRDAASLEAMAHLRAMAFDKTGTITQGRPQVVDYQQVDQRYSPHKVLSWLIVAESGSQHPLAQALISYAQSEGIEAGGRAESFRSMPGRGIEAEVEGHHILIGNPALLAERGVQLVEEESSTQAGESLLWLAIDQILVARLRLRDTARDEAQSVCAALRSQGLRCALLSGDAQASTQAIAEQVGIAEAHGDLLPADKVRLLRSLPQPAAMVGDGINDAPALAAAGVGIAVGSGTDVAMGAAAVVLPSPDLRSVLRAQHIAKKTLRAIRQNLFFAFVYNVLAIPLAAGLFYPFTGWLLAPSIAAAAMGMSSLCVVGNALRLRLTSSAEAA